MNGKLPYYIADHCDDAEWDKYYQMLKGPDGFECLLTEPEDRVWYRDLASAVDKLNEQHKRIAELERKLAEHEAWQKEACNWLSLLYETNWLVAEYGVPDNTNKILDLLDQAKEPSDAEV